MNNIMFSSLGNVLDKNFVCVGRIYPCLIDRRTPQ